MRTKFVVLFSLLVVGGMILAACTPAAEQAVVTVIVGGEVQVVTATPGAAPAGPKVVRVGIGIPGDIKTLDPNLAEDTYATTFVNATTIGLTYMNEADASLHPGMAETWDISEDGLTYTFHLLEGIPWVRWDGEQVVQVMDCAETPAPRVVTAHDFEYSFKRALNPETASPYAYVLAFAIEGAADYNSGEGTPMMWPSQRRRQHARDQVPERRRLQRQHRWVVDGACRAPVGHRRRHVHRRAGGRPLVGARFPSGLRSVRPEGMDPRLRDHHRQEPLLARHRGHSPAEAGRSRPHAGAG
jgi:hypothetical protein